MFKKIPWKTILLTIFAWTLFWEIKDTISGEKIPFFVRWPYYEMSFAKNIEIRTYLLTDEQVGYMFSHPNEDVQQPSDRDLNLKYVNVVLRIRNLLGGVTWGTLLWGSEGDWNKITIGDIPVPQQNNRFNNYVIPIGMYASTKKEGPPDPIIVKWDSLYIYR